MGVGFELSESLSGSWYRLDEPCTDRAIETRLHLGVGRDGFRRFLRERRIDVRGTIYIEGLAEGDGANPSAEGGGAPRSGGKRRGRPLFGTVTWRLFDQRRVPYDLELEGDDGKHYRLRGQRDFFVHDPFDSLTILPATLYDDAGAEIGRATLRFDPRTELPVTLKSIRPRLFR